MTTPYAAGVLIQQDNKILGLKHYVKYNRSLGFPLGKVDGGESPEAAAVRECFEETGAVVHVTDQPYFEDFVNGKLIRVYPANLLSIDPDHVSMEGYANFFEPSCFETGDFDDFNTRALRFFNIETKPLFRESDLMSFERNSVETLFEEDGFRSMFQKANFEFNIYRTRFASRPLNYNLNLGVFYLKDQHWQEATYILYEPNTWTVLMQVNTIFDPDQALDIFASRANLIHHALDSLCQKPC